MAQAYAETRQIVSTSHFEYPLDALANDIQMEYNRRGLDAYVTAIWKLRGETQDTVVMETLVPSASPISEEIIKHIIYLIALIFIGIVAIYGMAFLERWWPKPGEELEKFYELTMGKGFTSVDEMIKWKMENTPEEFAKHPYWCPYCGTEFADEKTRNDHMETCPEKPAPPPTYPTAPKYGLGILSYLVSLVGYRVTLFRIPWLRR